MIQSMSGADCEGVTKHVDSEGSSGSTTCANCGMIKQGKFCTVCGQNDRDYLRSLFPVVSQILSETFEADSRLWRTLSALFIRPGHLSLEFSRNRRADYVSPFRLYLFTSLLFFLMLSLTIGDDDLNQTEETVLAQQVAVSADEIAVDEVSKGIVILKSSLDEERRRKIDEIMARPETAISRNLFKSNVKGIAGGVAGLDSRMDIFFAGQLVDVFHAPWSVIQERVIAYLPVAMFFVLPLYALLLKLLFIRQRRFYVEHLVFSMHFHTIAFLVFSVTLMIPETWSGWIDFCLVLILMAYYFMAHKRFYDTGVITTSLSVLLLVCLYPFLLSGMILGVFAAVVVMF